MATVALNTGVSYQTMRGWSMTGEAAHSFEVPGEISDYPSPTFGNYKDDLLAAALDLGLNRVRLEWRFDDCNATTYTINSPFPNATDPTSGTIHFDRYHHAMDAWVSDYRNMLIARGETLFITMCFVDFRTGGFQAELTPSKYAFAVAAVLEDFYDSYSFLPDAIEPILEPENGDNNHTTWTAENVSDNIVAARSALIALDTGGSPGFGSIPFMAPSVTSVANAVSFIQDMEIENPSVISMIDTFSYHRYGGTNTDVADLWSEASGGKETMMSEWIGASHLTLYDDLTIGHVSAWEQYTLTFPPYDTGGEYFQVNTTSWAVTPSERTKYLKHYFHAVRMDAIRKGASISGTGSGNGAPTAFVNTNGTYVVVVKCTGAVTFDISGLPDGTYEVRYTTGDGTNTPSAEWQSLSDQVVSGGNTGNIAMPGAGVITIYDQTFLDQPAVDQPFHIGGGPLVLNGTYIQF